MKINLKTGKKQFKQIKVTSEANVKVTEKIKDRINIMENYIYERAKEYLEVEKLSEATKDELTDVNMDSEILKEYSQQDLEHHNFDIGQLNRFKKFINLHKRKKMKLEKIKEILSLPIPNSDKEVLILKEISNDKKALPFMMIMLDNERESDKELITDMNLELSRTHIHIKESKVVKKQFVLDSIKEFYIKYKEKVSHCFNQKFE